LDTKEAAMKLGKLVTRVVIGSLFVGHGTQKLFGWFDGPGPDQTGEYFEATGLRPGRRHAMLAGAAEAGGGALLALGLFTPLATAALSGVMVTAIRKVHLEKGPWNTNGGYEYNLVLLAALMALADDGPGSASLDAALGTGVKGPAVAIGQLAAGVAGSQIAIAGSDPRQWRPGPTEVEVERTAEPVGQG
jgi:putative oxidoreductase